MEPLLHISTALSSLLEIAPFAELFPQYPVEYLAGSASRRSYRGLRRPLRRQSRRSLPLSSRMTGLSRCLYW
jgi:hypothetical protein